MKGVLYALLIMFSATAVIIGIFKWTDYKLKQRFSQKSYWAVCVENQGMVTNELFLYKDSTFYTEIFKETHTGHYRIVGDTLSLFFHHGKGLLSETYVFESPDCDNCMLQPMTRGKESLTFYKKEGIGILP